MAKKQVKATRTSKSKRTKPKIAPAKAKSKAKTGQAKRANARLRVDRRGLDAMGSQSGFGIPFKVNKGQDIKQAAQRALGQETRWPHELKIGKRFRLDNGNIKGLAESISARGGLLQAITIDNRNQLIDGGRRLLAWQHEACTFRDQPIPVFVVDIDSIVAGEYDANAQRNDFTPSEAVAIKRVLEPTLKAEAKARQRAHGGTAPGRRKKQGDLFESAPTIGGGIPRSDAASRESGRAADRVAKLVGKDRRTLEKAEKIVEAAEADPERFGKLKDDMDRTGRVDAPYRRLKVMQAAAEIRKAPPPLPMRGPYRGGFIDPPWPAEPEEDDPERLARGYYPYPTMSIDELAKLDVPSICHADCVIGLWITNFHLALGHHLPLLEAWSFRPVTIRTWVKDRMGRGAVLRGQTEHLIIARRGKPVIDTATITTFFHAAINPKAHSQKPQKAYEDFARLIASERYFSLFETIDRGEQWDCHGDQVGKDRADGESQKDNPILPEAARDVHPFMQNDDGLEIPACLRRAPTAEASP